MFLINHDLKAIYIWTPECANNFISFILVKYYGFKQFEKVNRDDISDFFDNDEHLINSIEYYRSRVFSIRKHGILRYMLDHEDNNTLQNMTEEKWKDYYKFTFVRNPYEKIISCYHDLKLNIRPDDNESNYVSFQAFLDNKDQVGNVSFFNTFIKQYEHVLDYSNQLNMQYIGSSNDVNRDLLHILSYLGVNKMTHLENSDETNFYINQFDNFIDYYDQESLDKVNELFSDDFACFGFPKILDIDEFKTFYKPIQDRPLNNIDDLYLDSKMHILNNEKLSQGLTILREYTTNFFTNIDIIYNITSENNFLTEQKQGVLSRIERLERRLSLNKTIKHTHENDGSMSIINDFVFHCDQCCQFTCYTSTAKDAHLFFCKRE